MVLACGLHLFFWLFQETYTFGLSKYCSVNYWTFIINPSTQISEIQTWAHSNPISFNVKWFSTFCTKYECVKGSYVIHSWHDEIYSRFSHLDFWRLWNEIIGVSIFFSSSTKNQEVTVFLLTILNMWSVNFWPRKPAIKGNIWNGQFKSASCSGLGHFN
jgi:hypothetical protein